VLQDLAKVARTAVRPGCAMFAPVYFYFTTIAVRFAREGGKVSVDFNIRLVRTVVGRILCVSIQVCFHRTNSEPFLYRKF